MAVRLQDRLVSLDAFRGLTIAAMVLVNNPGDWGHLYAPLAHARWHGWTPTDLIFPFFLFIVGVSMVFSMAHRDRADDTRTLLGLWRRAAVIVLLGLGLNLVPAFDLATLRWPGVLQRIGLCVALAAPLVVWGGWRTWLVAAATACGIHLAVMLGWPVVGADGQLGAGRLEPGQDAGAALDRWLMGGHLWAASKTWDPEGMLGTLPALATLLIGALTGHALRGTATPQAKTVGMALAGVAGVLLGLWLDRALMPINKSLWTVSYVVFTGGAALIGLALCHGLMDALGSERMRQRHRRWLLPFTVYGMNALFIFVLSGLVARLLGFYRVGGEHAAALALGSTSGPAGTVSVKTWLASWPKAWIGSPELASLAYALAFNLVMFAVAWWMWRRRWFVKV